MTGPVPFFALSRMRADGFGAAADYIESLPADIPMADLAPLRPQQHAAAPAAVTDSLKYGSFNNVILNVGLVSQLVLPQPQAGSVRTFLLIVNTHATQSLFVRFGAQSDALIGLVLLPVGGAIGLDAVVSQDDIHIIGNGAATTGVLIYCNKNALQAG